MHLEAKMSKKRNQQPHANGELSAGSTDSCDDSSTTGRKCSHIAKAMNFNKVKKRLNKIGIDAECPACKKNKTESSNIAAEECETNSTTWICLQCGHQGCGRDESGHALEHYKKPYSDCHFMAVDTLHWSVWCYCCEAKVHIGCRKKLQETVEFIKKHASTCSPSETKVALSPCPKEKVNVNTQKEKILNNFPKVGGLINLDNTCFFNAVLQCLAQTPFLVKVLDDLRLPGQKFILPGGKHKLPNTSDEIELPPIEGTLESWGSFTSILCKTLVQMQTTDGRLPYSPFELFNSFKKKSMQCMDGGQHDAHELLRHLLEIVRNEDLRRYQSVILKEVGLNEKTNPEGVEESFKSRIKFYGNQASARLLGPELVFRGVLVSTLECLDCNHSSQSTEPFLDLSLPVMADKPQPPILKRKKSSCEDSFDVLGNTVSHTPSKYQLKKEKKAARKNRKNKKQGIPDSSSVTQNRNDIIEENNGNVVELEESDADIEDNIETESLLQEIGKSDHSSEKQSTLASPASPTALAQTNETINELPLDNDIDFSRIDSLFLVQHQEPENTDSLCSPSPTDASVVNFAQTKVLNRLDSSEGQEIESTVQTGLSLPPSLAESWDVTSPEGPTISLSSLTSKESPSNPDTPLINGEHLEQTERPTSRFSIVESLDHNEQEEVTWTQRKVRRKTEESANEVCNGVNGITSGISKMSVSSNLQQSPTRYVTKEGQCTIQSCLNQFTALELMSGSNKVGCEACTAKERKVNENCKMVCTPSTKQYLISQVPAVLILHLKRFRAQRVDFRKVTRHVSFPVLLDVAPICKDHKKAKIYALYGVVEHSGTIHGGHYVAYVKSRQPLEPSDPRWSFLPSKDVKDVEESSSNSNSGPEEAAATLSSTVQPPPGKWYHVSDSRVREVDETTVLQCQAYLLFYERIL